MGRGVHCEQCGALLKEASSAVMEHLRAESKLELARCRREAHLVPDLETLTAQALEARTTAMQAYKTHRASHNEP